MRIEHTDIAGVALVHWTFAHDDRGCFARTFCEAEFADAGLAFRVVQANTSRNPLRHTLRGLHFQKPPYEEPKIISCVRGRIWEVAVDFRSGSPTYLKWCGFELSPDDDCSVHLPKGIAHGFLSLEPDTEVQYLMGAAYVPEAVDGLRWNDPTIGIHWPTSPSVISGRDAAFALLADR